MTDAETIGRLFRQAWVDGVTKHYPGTPKPGYVAPWEDMPQWEQQAATSVGQLLVQFLESTEGAATRLSRTQKGQLVSLLWNGHIHKHFEDPKPSYVADWVDLPQWQQETDSDIFEAFQTR